MGRKPTELPALLRGRSFSTARALELGVGAGRLRGSDLHRPLRGVRSAAAECESLLARCRALATVLQPWQVFAGPTSARLLGMPLPTEYAAGEPLHVLSLDGRDGMRRDGVVGGSTRAPVGVVRKWGIQFAAAPDTWCRLASPPTSLSREWLVAVGDFLISGERTDFGRRAPLCTLADLDDALARHGRKRGAASLAWARPRLRTGVDSARETSLRLHIVAARLPEPDVQVPVPTAVGVRHADLGYPQRKLLLEYLGDQHRTSRRRWLDDLTRVQLFQDAGYRVMLIGSADLEPDPAPLIARIRRALG